MAKNNLKKNKSDKPITEGFFTDYMDDFAASVARGFSGMQEYTDKRFEQVDKRFDRIEHQDAADHASIRAEIKSGLEKIECEIVEIKDKLNCLDKRTDQDDSALFSDIDKLRDKIARLEKEVKILKLNQSKT